MELKSVKSVNALFLLVLIINLFLGSVIMPYFPAAAADYLPQFLFILLPALVFIKLRKKSFKETLRLNAIGLIDILILILITFAMNPLINFIASLSTVIFGDSMSILFADVQNYTLAKMIFTIGITPAICEEVIMRGVILDGYRGMSIRKAALMNGFLFGIFHMNFNQFSYAFLMGIVLTYVVYATDSLFAGIVIHFVNNTWSSLTTAIDHPALNLVNNILNTTGGPIGILMVVLSVLITAMLVHLLIERNAKEEQFFQPEKAGQKCFDWTIWISIGLFLLSSIFLSIVASIGSAFM